MYCLSAHFDLYPFYQRDKQSRTKDLRCEPVCPQKCFQLGPAIPRPGHCYYYQNYSKPLTEKAFLLERNEDHDEKGNSEVHAFINVYAKCLPTINN